MRDSGKQGYLDSDATSKNNKNHIVQIRSKILFFSLKSNKIHITTEVTTLPHLIIQNENEFLVCYS
jgi:hypothetical protein